MKIMKKQEVVSFTLELTRDELKYVKASLGAQNYTAGVRNGFVGTASEHYDFYIKLSEALG